MTFANLLTQTLTHRRAAPGAVDAYNNPTAGHEDETVSGRIDQASTTENVDGRDVTTTRLVLFLEPTVTVTPADQFIDNTTTPATVYAVDGAPAPIQGRSGVHHREVPLRVIAAS